MSERIHFVHGNGFPSPCYRQLFNALEGTYSCYYLDRVGHNPDFPITQNWDYLVSEVLASIQLQADAPVIGIGHSLGGVLTLLGSIQRPELFKAVILLDSPLLGPIKSWLIRISRALGLMDHLTPALKTRQRRQHWTSREQVLSYLHRRALFKSFDEACLQDYIDYGMDCDEHGYSLRFERQVEYQIYRTMPYTSPKLAGVLPTPTVLIYGDRSHLIQREELRHMKKKFGITCVETHGGHMYPMEYPTQTAAQILAVLDTLKNPF